MSDFRTEFWFVVILALLVGIGIGCLIQYMIRRPKPGEKTVSELQTELDDYKMQVSEHFSKTSDLFKDMTEHYRGLYHHMAAGATSLCDSQALNPELELTTSELLPEHSEQTTLQPDAELGTDDTQATLADEDDRLTNSSPSIGVPSAGTAPPGETTTAHQN